MTRDFLDPLQIVIIGLSDSGKTTFARRLCGLEPDLLIQPTMGIDVHIESLQGLKFFLYDLGGQTPFVGNIWPITIPKADAVIYVLDSAFTKDYGKIRENISKVANMARDVPFLILANKQDLSFAKRKKMLAELLQLETLLPPEIISNYQLFPISALSGMGVAEAIDWLVHQIITKMDVKVPQIYDIYVYDRTTGLPCGYLCMENNWKTNEEKEADQATLISAFYAALNNFSNDFVQSDVQSLTLRRNDPEHPHELLLFNYNDQTTTFSCLIVADSSDDNRHLELLAKLLLKRLLQEKLMPEMIGNLLDLREHVLEILRHVLPSGEDTSLFLSINTSWLRSLDIDDNKKQANHQQSTTKFQKKELHRQLETTETIESEEEEHVIQKITSGDNKNSREMVPASVAIPNSELTSVERESHDSEPLNSMKNDEYLLAFRKLRSLEKRHEAQRRKKRGI